MPPHPPSSDTTELLTLMQGSAAGAGMQLYDRFADRVHDFVLFLTRDRGLAAEITRDVIVMTANSPTPFSTAPQLRSWLYARARDETFALLGLRGRSPAEDRVIPLDPLPADHTAADLAHLVYEATAAFSERDLALLTLHLRHGLDGAALGEAMGLSEDAVEVLLPATLERVEAQTTALVVLATGAPDAAPDVAALHEEWDGTFSPLVRRRAVELADQLTGRDDLSSAPSPLDLLRHIPPSPAPASLRDAVRDRLRLTGALGGGASSAPLVADPLTDPTVPPGARPSASDDDDRTIPPVAAAGPAASAGDVPTGEDVPTGPGRAVRLGTSVGTPVAPVADTPADPPAPVTARKRLPRPLAIGLGVAVALVVASGLFRMVADTGDEQDAAAVSLATPPSITEGAARGEQSAFAASAPGATTTVPGPTVLQEAAPAPSTPRAEPEPARAGVITVPSTPLVLGQGVPAPLRLTNPGGTPVDFELIDAPDWIGLSRVRGTVGAGAVVEVTVTLDDALPEGDYSASLPVRWGGEARGMLLVDLRGSSERDPVPQDVQVGSRTLLARGCGLDSTEVAVTVLDESTLREVVVVATPPGTGPSIRFRLDPDPDPDRPGRYVGVVGPFDEAGAVTMTLEATDVRGNSATGDAGEIMVAPCPG